MSRENVEIVKASWEAYARGEFDASLGAYAERTEWDDRNFRPDGRIHRGREALWNVVRTWRGTFSEYSFELDRVVDAGDETVVIYRDRGRGKGSGAEVHSEVGLVHTVEDGKITRTVVYRSAEEALEAARVL